MVQIEGVFQVIKGKIAINLPFLLSHENMNTSIRRATTDDLQALVSLFDQYRVFYEKPSDPQGALHFLSARLEAQDSVIFVAEQTETLTGFVQLYPIFSSTNMKRLWLLNDLFVAPEYRGQGISVQLIERSKQLSRETKALGLTLETTKSNDIGNNLYPRAGFKLNDACNFYYWES